MEDSVYVYPTDSIPDSACRGFPSQRETQISVDILTYINLSVPGRAVQELLCLI
jgi:hypothetical protein